MKILMLNYEFPPLGGGASPVGYEISKGYVKLGHEVTVVTMGFKSLPEYEEIDGIKVHRVKCLRKKKEICTPIEMLSYVISAKRFLRKHLKENKYDINHTHFIIPTGLISLWVKKKFRIPYIITSHGSDVPGFNTDRFKFIHMFTKPLLYMICKNAKYITTPSNYLKDLIIKNINGGLESNIISLPNGSRDFYVKGYKKEDIIFSSGRLLKRKGFHHLINAFIKLENTNWKLYIVGDGPYMQELKNLSKSNKNIIFTGWLDNKGKEYEEIVNKSKIFSLLSQSESQGVVFLEAMSANCAILASNITACKETVTKDIGFLVSIENPNEVINKLRILMNNQKKLNQFMEESRKRYEHYYQYNKIIKKYEGLLTK